ncbi:MAG: flagellar type III secretion system protein FlhB [Pseudomonadota bacterium]
MSGQSDEADKSFEPTAQKLEKARKKGEFPKSTDLHTAAAYAGLTLALLAFGEDAVRGFGTVMMVLLDQAASLAPLMVDDSGTAAMGSVLLDTARTLAPLFFIPALAVLTSVLAQRAFVVTPSKLQPKLNRVNPLSNAKNKFGRAGLFEFFKSFLKLVIYSAILAFFLSWRMADIMSAVTGNPMLALQLMAELLIAFLAIVILVAAAIGALDAMFQHQEHLRKNRMSRKEVQDEHKEAEGDPHLKQERRQRAQAIAMTQMMADVPGADVVVVNPTHYAVALRWDRSPGSAPACVAKGVDEVALRIREVAAEHGVPIHSDPPTARALHATTEIGDEITPDQYQAVAAAIRFAEAMRKKARDRFV